MRRKLHLFADALRAQPGDHADAARKNHWFVLGTLAIIVLAEIVVAVAYAPGVGLFLLGVTGTLGLLEHRGERFASFDRRRAMERYAEQRTEALRTDTEPGLPNRQLLIEQLTREIARAERYREPVTVAVVRIGQFEQLVGHWGRETTHDAVTHVADTLRRITRQSDFIARLDESRFCVVLVQCSEDQASIFGERISVAVANRSLHAGAEGKLPLFVNCDVTALEYDSERFRGPLAFLSAAGGELVQQPRVGGVSLRDGHALRRQLIGNHASDGRPSEPLPLHRRAS